MINIKNTIAINTRVLTTCFSVLFLFAMQTAVAQKSSGVLEDNTLQSFTQSVENIDDTVTQNAATAGNAVRFLIRPIREANVSPNRFTADKSKSSLDEQKALLKQAQVDQRNCKVIAPFSGGVTSRDIQAFEAVTPSVIVMSIIDDNGLIMSLNVPSSFVNKVKPEDTFTVVVDETGKTYAAKVVGVSPAIDPMDFTR